MATDPTLDRTLVMLDEQDATEVHDDVAEARALAARIGLPFDPLDEFHIDPELFRAIPVEVMLRYQFLPLASDGEVLRVVMADPSNVVQLNEVELALARPLDVLVGPPTRIADILEKSESTQRVLDEATEGFQLQLVQEAEDGEEVLSIDRITADSSPIIRLVDSVLFNAIQRRASDIHIETQDREVVVKYRIDGVLYQAMKSIDKRHHSTIISRIKVMSELDIAEKRIPQDGRFKVRFSGRTIDFRVSIMPNVHGEDAVIRILDKESTNAEFRTLNLSVLGLEEDTKAQLRKFIREPYGMVLVTGPTGSGKTTTLYACLSEIQSSEDKIITIEDPVEYQLKGITQIPVNEKKGICASRWNTSMTRFASRSVISGVSAETPDAVLRNVSAETPVAERRPMPSVRPGAAPQPRPALPQPA